MECFVIIVYGWYQIAQRIKYFWKKNSLTLIDDVIRYLGNVALTKKSDGFSKSLA